MYEWQQEQRRAWKWRRWREDAAEGFWIGTVLAVRFLTVAVMLGVSCGIAWRVAQIVAAALGG
ncbi:MAG: hypothetical protein HOO99_04105 [Hyphomicrobiaceae bacterium]|nr:hypothetical protein [Hyphomicrobiaceae bacterium]